MLDSFIVDSFEEVVDMVMHCSHSVKPFFCSWGGEFVVVIEVYGAWIKAIETSAEREIVGSGSCSVIGKFCKREHVLWESYILAYKLVVGD